MLANDRPEPSPYQPPLSATAPTRRPFGVFRFWRILGILCVAALVFYGAGKLIGTRQSTVVPETAVPRDANPGLDGVIASDMPAAQFRVGDCLQGFTDPLQPATVVTCENAHNAQYIGSFLAEGDAFPGSSELLSLSEKGCKAIRLDPGSALDSSWLYRFSHPSKATWAEGDRAVDCFLSLTDGTVRSSLLPQTPVSMHS
ncbi:septum formation family protein [Paeniglutamicibacter cryotolerans]|uniref:Septum formation-related domain-containing protein n=1 Tax=Paeniglutamicibacter cryotolerans TaxID=670079 RepID=A0A839QDJ9_9MICC|nr:septum formation family protein [Paeniglutamicibacter cryotolerans]MBB2994268.1 hypothetical protein [Paeniglutamicibacter cryotolerans]